MFTKKKEKKKADEQETKDKWRHGNKLLLSYENWVPDQWSAAATGLSKGLTSWNFRTSYARVKFPTSKKMEDCWLTLHLEFLLIWKNITDILSPPPSTAPPDTYLPLAILNFKLIEEVFTRTQKDAIIGERLLKYENCFRIGAGDQEHLFEFDREEDFKAWMSAIKDDTIVGLLRSRKHFVSLDPDEVWEAAIQEIPLNWLTSVRDLPKDGMENEWLDRVEKIKAGHAKHGENIKRLRCWSRFATPNHIAYLNWLASGPKEDGFLKEMITAETRLAEKWKTKFLDFKTLEKHFPQIQTISHGKRDRLIQHTERMIHLLSCHNRFHNIVLGNESKYLVLKPKWEHYRSQIIAVKEAVLLEEQRRREEEERARKAEIKRQKKLAKEALKLQAV
eukprot:TRINITY_DN7266_c0_g1_i5.p1 TRINITY_DN7266_c0_g1~~TRINITY_DN7266_c0_g1_i5.p1  ORF type:complete len:391 (-),score=83.55 TRINITY_DN7266_c0_g1_i5:341-1513(-)